MGTFRKIDAVQSVPQPERQHGSFVKISTGERIAYDPDPPRSLPVVSQTKPAVQKKAAKTITVPTPKASVPKYTPKAVSVSAPDYDPMVAQDLENRRKQGTSGFSTGKLVGDTVKRGTSEIAGHWAGGLAAVEDAIGYGLGFLTLQPGVNLAEGGPFNTWYQAILKDQQAADRSAAPNLARGGKAAETVYKYGTQVVAAVPQAAAAIMTGGASAAASTANLARTAAAATAPAVAKTVPGIAKAAAQTVSRAASDMGRNPLFWSSFGEVVGPGYQQARSEGHDPATAAAYAIVNAIPNAAIEVGGGLQKVPGAVQGGASIGRAILWSGLEEAMEEPAQGIVERTAQNAILNRRNPLFSLSDPSAILNPRTSAEEALGGFVVGSILSGGQAAAQTGIDAYVQNQIKQQLQIDRITQLEKQQGKDTLFLTLDNQDDIIPTIEETTYKSREQKKKESFPESRKKFLQRLRPMEGIVIIGRTAFKFQKPQEPISFNAQISQEALTALGVPSIIADRRVEINLDNMTLVRDSFQGGTMAKQLVVLNNHMLLPPLETAAHEAVHFWYGTEARQAFQDIVDFELIPTSPAFKYYQQEISKAYLGDNDFDLFDLDLMEKFQEEFYAYVGGQIHSGKYESMLRPMFRNYDAVKAAWNQLAEYGRTHPVEMSFPIQYGTYGLGATDVDFDPLLILGKRENTADSVQLVEALYDGYVQQVNARESFGPLKGKSVACNSVGSGSLMGLDYSSLTDLIEQVYASEMEKFSMKYQPSLDLEDVADSSWLAEALYDEYVQQVNARESFGPLGGESVACNSVGSGSLMGLDYSSLTDLIEQVYASEMEKFSMKYQPSLDLEDVADSPWLAEALYDEYVWQINARKSFEFWEEENDIQ